MVADEVPDVRHCEHHEVGPRGGADAASTDASASRARARRPETEHEHVDGERVLYRTHRAHHREHEAGEQEVPVRAQTRARRLGLRVRVIR